MAALSWEGLDGPSAIPYLLHAGILSAEPTPDEYTWKPNPLSDGDTQDEEELFVTEDYAVLSRGGIVRRVFGLDIEGQSIVKAVITWLPSPGGDGPVKNQEEYSQRADAKAAPDGSAPVGARYFQGWSSRGQAHSGTFNRQKINREDGPKPHTRQINYLGAKLSPALVVALRNQIHIFYYTGTSHVVHLPFEVETILPSAQGIIIKRKFLVARHAHVHTQPVSAFPVNPPNSFAHSHPSFGSGTTPRAHDASWRYGSQADTSATPTRLFGNSQPSQSAQADATFTQQPETPCFYSLPDPLAEPALIFTTDRHGLGTRSLATGPRTSALSPLSSDEEVVYVTTPTELASVASAWAPGSSLALAVTYNPRTNSYTVWQVVPADSRPLSARKKRRDASTSAFLSRRQSSLAPGTANSRPGTGANTPIAYFAKHARESFGDGGTRSQNPHLHSSLYGSTVDRQGDKHQKETSQLATSLDLELDGEMLPSKQARRVSSLLARADLASSQSKLPFSDVSGGNLGSFTNARREPSFGASIGGPRTRRSNVRSARSSFQTAFTSASTPVASETGSMYGEVDDPADDVPWIAGYDGGGAVSRAAIGSAGGALILRRIDSVSVNSSPSRFERLSKEPNIFTVVSPPGAATPSIHSPSFVLCIVHYQTPAAVVFHLSFTLERRQQSAKPWQHDKRRNHPSPDSHQVPVVRHAGVARFGDQVNDATKIVDRGISRVALGHDGDSVRKLLMLRSDGRPCVRMVSTKESTPVDFGSPGLPHPGPKQDGSARKESDRETGSGTGFSRYASPGTVSAIGAERNGLLLMAQLRPHDSQIATILDICMLVLPGQNGEGVLTTWWAVVRWLHDRDEGTAHIEWMALVMTMMSMALLFLGNSGSMASRRVSKRTGRATGSISSSRTADHWNEMLQHECHTITDPEWVRKAGWDCSLESQNQRDPEASRISHERTRSSDTTGHASNAQSAIWNENTFLQQCNALTRAFFLSDDGAAATLGAFGGPGHLPTARGRDAQVQRTALPTILVALHLYREELKLGITTSESEKVGVGRLTALLAQLGAWLGWEAWSWRETGYYSTEDATMDRWIFDEGSITILAVPGQQFEPPSIYDWVEKRLAGDVSQPFLMLSDMISPPRRDYQPGEGMPASITEYWQSLTPRTPKIVKLFTHITTESKSARDIVEKMVELGLDRQFLETLPEGIAAPLQDAIAACQPEPPTTWDEEALRLIGRDDLRLLLTSGPTMKGGSTASTLGTHDAVRDVHGICESAFETETVGAFDGVAEMDRQAITRLIFRQDRRFAEAAKLLQSTKPTVLLCNPEPEWSEMELLEAEKELVQTVAFRTLSVPAGRGLLYLSARLPMLTERFPVSGFNLACVMKPSNNTVSGDRMAFSEEKVAWAFFHAGVAAGLSISRDAKGIDTSWIMYNKPPDLTNRHAGFLLALGLNGHLKSIAKWVAFKYLTPKHTMTSIGLLLGLSASYLGTMDPLVTRLLSVHVTCMLPPGAAELNLSPLTQTTGLMATGLLYCNTQHRRMSEVMLSEMEHIDQDEPSTHVETFRDEGYRLAAGFALGFINLGKGKDLKGMHDMQIVGRLLTLAVGNKKVSIVHVLDKSMAAATIAITLIFMKSHDGPLARKIDVPDSLLQFDYVRPDLFLLRTVAKHLIMWNHIEAKHSWIETNLPLEFRSKTKLGSINALKSEDMAYVNIVAGLCLSMGLRFAGSSSIEARDILTSYLEQFMRLCRLPVIGYDQKLTRSTIRNCQDVIALSAATVMAGTGDLHLFRRLRSLHGRVNAEVSYGSHFAAHMAVGILFLGGGTHTFGTSDLAVGSLLCAFHPLLPRSILDNTSHLQAFRHLCVLAAEARCIIPRDAVSYRPLSIPVHITLRDGSERRRTAPCLLPELQDISTVSTASNDHWPVVLDFGRNPGHVASFGRNQSIYIRDRAAYYSSDGSSTSVFHATLQALNDIEASSGGSIMTSSTSASTSRHQFEWFLTLKAFDLFDKTERALLLRSSAAGGGGGGGVGGGAGSGGGVGSIYNQSNTTAGATTGTAITTTTTGDQGGMMMISDASTTETNLVDSRLVLELQCLQAERADQLRNLRLLFAYAERATEGGREGNGDQEREMIPLRWIKMEVVERLRATVWKTMMEIV
ncbi:MAG: hypothetical protein M1823_002291 [Watsoniomyces obsoletus]|nr:MAG: hypothetical protein M1823_002291 [Watsoniomyces obsoletus]